MACAGAHHRRAYPNTVRRNILKIVGGIAAALILLEVLIRMSGLTWYDLREVDPKTGLLRFSPNSEIRVKRSCFETIVHSNSDGFYAREYAIEKPEGVTRVAILGDSMIEGVQVSMDENVAVRLELLMRGAGYQVEVMPFGISSRGTYINMRTYEAYVKKYKPDIVIDAFLMSNDLNDDTSGPFAARFDADGSVSLTAPLQTQKAFIGHARGLMRHSALVMSLYRAVQGVSMQSRTETLGGSVPPAYQPYSKERVQAIEDAWFLEEKLLKKFKEVAEENSAHFVVVSLTEAYRVHPDVREQVIPQKVFERLDFSLPEQRLAEIATQLDILYLPLLAPFIERARTSGELSYLPCDGHWSATGHQWAAEEIATFLLKNPTLIGGKR